MNTPEKASKLQYRIDIILTVFFLIVIFVMGICTIVTDYSGIYTAATTKSRLEGYTGTGWEETPAWDRLSARIRSVDDYLGENVFMATELGYVNSSFQYGLGKRLITTGASHMVKLNSGHLYDLQNYVPMEKGMNDIKTMQQIVPEDIPFLFVYEHPSLYSASQMPAGYDVLDYSEEMCDEIVAYAEELDIPMLDSREILNNSGLELSELLLYTDQHWKTRSAMVMAKEIAETVEEMTGTALHPEKLDISNFETETYPELFLGKYGQRVGTLNIAPDDITIYWPKYDTYIERETNYVGVTTNAEGSFKDSVIRWEYLEPDPGKTWNMKAYFDYGLTEHYDMYNNPDGADCTILVLKDSYSAGIASFLSLLADEVVAVDLRRSNLLLDEWIEKCNPDMVIVSYSLQMLRSDEYVFM